MKMNNEGTCTLTIPLRNAFSVLFSVDIILNAYVSDVISLLKISHFSHMRVLQFMHRGESSFIQPHITRNSSAVS
jgi:hypothetical protein